MPKLLKLTFKSDHKIGKTLYTAGQSLTLPDVYLFGSVEQVNVMHHSISSPRAQA